MSDSKTVKPPWTLFRKDRLNAQWPADWWLIAQYERFFLWIQVQTGLLRYQTVRLVWAAFIVSALPAALSRHAPLTLRIVTAFALAAPLVYAITLRLEDHLQSKADRTQEPQLSGTPFVPVCIGLRLVTVFVVAPVMVIFSDLPVLGVLEALSLITLNYSGTLTTWPASHTGRVIDWKWFLETSFHYHQHLWDLVLRQKLDEPGRVTED